MGRKANTQTLAERHYLTCGQCARVFGHAPSWWSQAFDEGQLEGYRYGRRNIRYIVKTSADAYLKRVGRPAPQAAPMSPKQALRKTMDRWFYDMDARKRGDGSGLNAEG